MPDPAWTRHALRAIAAALICFLVASVWVLTTKQAAAEDVPPAPPVLVTEPVTEPEEVEIKEDGLMTRFSKATSYIFKGDSSEIVSEANTDLQAQRDSIAQQEAALAAEREALLNAQESIANKDAQLDLELEHVRAIKRRFEQCLVGAMEGSNESASVNP